MVFYSLLAAVSFALLASVSGAPTRQSRRMVVHESRSSSGVPAGFTHAGAPSGNSTVNLRVALAAQDLKSLESKVYDVSTPGSASYGQHLTKEEVQALAGPTAETVSAVTGWLTSNGVTAQTSGAYDDWLNFAIPVEQANTLLNADFQNYVYEPTGETLIRTMSYSLPQNIKPHVDLVHPTTAFVSGGLSGRAPTVGPTFSFPVTNSTSNIGRRANTAPPECDTTGTPACLQALYGIPTDPATQQNNQLAVSGFLGEFAQTADLQSFLKALRPDISPDTTFQLETLDGGQNTQGAASAGTEANLDIQYTIGVATNVPTTFVSVGDQNQDGVNGFLDIVNFLGGKDAPPQVLTTSYGFDETVIPAELASRMCDAYMALGARGVSILFSSGDGGVSGSQAKQCTTFIPTFPSGCPFVTSVGSTHLIQETAAAFSSGGFSEKFPIPDFQKDAVAAYLQTLGDTNQGLFNAQGRGFPDVSTQGQQMEIFNAGQAAPVSGTSASSPIFASTISLINDRLLAAGKQPLGFLNPFLYTNPGAFFDITTGSNPGCNTQGFPAATGWDPVTGLGTPNFPELLKAAGL